MVITILVNAQPRAYVKIPSIPSVANQTKHSGPRKHQRKVYFCHNGPYFASMASHESWSVNGRANRNPRKLYFCRKRAKTNLVVDVTWNINEGTSTHNVCTTLEHPISCSQSVTRMFSNQTPENPGETQDHKTNILHHQLVELKLCRRRVLKGTRICRIRGYLQCWRSLDHVVSGLHRWGHRQGLAQYVAALWWHCTFLGGHYSVLQDLKWDCSLWHPFCQNAPSWTHWFEACAKDEYLFCCETGVEFAPHQGVPAAGLWAEDFEQVQNPFLAWPIHKWKDSPGWPTSRSQEEDQQDPSKHPGSQDFGGGWPQDDHPWDVPMPWHFRVYHPENPQEGSPPCQAFGQAAPSLPYTQSSEAKTAMCSTYAKTYPKNSWCAQEDSDDGQVLGISIWSWDKDAKFSVVSQGGSSSCALQKTQSHWEMPSHHILWLEGDGAFRIFEEQDDQY